MKHPVEDEVDARLAARLAELRGERGWSLGELAERSGVSRSTLSRAERAEISPTAALLNRLCHVYGRTMSRLLSEVEAQAGPVPLVRADEQGVWEDRASGFVRRSVSPPHPALRGELVEGRPPRAPTSPTTGRPCPAWNSTSGSWRAPSR